jgi:hypothetical protein
MVVSSGPEGIVLSDGYVLPPPPNVGTPGAGVWRDQSKMVASKGANLPERCVKCKAPATGARLKKTLSWHHPLIFILAFVALLIYLIVAIIYFVVAVRIVWPARIDDKFAWVKGINKDYLNDLPPWPGV